MKRIALAVSVVLLMVVQASAMDYGTGGYVYWNRSLDVSSYIAKQTLWKVELDCAFTKVGSVANFDNVAMNNTYISWTTQVRNNSLEVYDPRDQGGQGTLLQVSIVNNTPPASGYTGPNYDQPWDIIKVDPSKAPGSMQTNVCDGRLGTGYPNWSTQYLGRAMAAPNPWVPGTTPNSLSIATLPNIWSNYVNALYDTNASGQIDNNAGEGQLALYEYEVTPIDAEMGRNQALYYSTGSSVRRMYLDGTGTGHSQVILSVGGTLGGKPNPVGSRSDGMGIAVGPGANPTVYLMACENGTGLDTVFGMRDLNGDNAIDDVRAVWQRGQLGITRLHDANINFYGEDVEYYQNPTTGKQFLFANGYSGNLFVLELADNGLLAVDGKYILGGNQEGPSWGQSGFELDMNPGVIPEPGTMLLLSSGALGVMGWMRRRRMK